MIENTNTKQFYPGPILNNTLEITDFLFNDAEQIKIKHSKLNEEDILVDVDLNYPTDYEVTKVLPSDINAAEAALTASTGQVMLKNVNVLAGEKLTVYRVSQIIQDKDYPRTGAFPAATHEGALDYLTMQNQEQKDEIDRALKVPISTQNFEGSLPLPIPARALKINNDGTGFEMSEFDPDLALVTTEEFKNQSQQAATAARASQVAAANSEAIAIAKTNELVTTQQSYLQEATELRNELISTGDGIIKRIGYTMFDTVIKDHILSYEESQGLSLQGTWVYKNAIAGERYGYADFYNKCLEEYLDKDNVKECLVLKTGNLISNNGRISNFGHGSYAKTLVNFNPGNDAWEIVTKFCCTSRNSRNQVIFDCNTGNTRIRPITCHIKTSVNLLTLGLSSVSYTTTDTRPDILPETTGKTVIELNTEYYVKLEFTGSQYNLYLSTLGDFTGEESLEVSVTSSTAIAGDCPLVFGIYRNSDAPLYGYIDLTETSIKIGNKQDACGIATINKNGHAFYDTAIKPIVDEGFQSIGFAWLYGIDQANERVFLPRNNYFDQFTADISAIGTGSQSGAPDIIGSANFASGSGSNRAGNVRACTGAFGAKTPVSRIWTASTTQLDQNYELLDLAASQVSPVYSNSTIIQPPAVRKLLYICVGNTVSDTSWVDVVTQVEGGVKDIEGKTNEGIHALSNASNALRQTQITNCLLEVPQRIKYTLENGTLTIKAGSVVIVPYGVEDLTSQYSKGATFINDNFKVYDTQFEDGKFFVWAEVQNDIINTAATEATEYRTAYISLTDALVSSLANTESGTADTTTNTYTLYYNTALNLISGSRTTTPDYSDVRSLPIFRFYAAAPTMFSSIDQVFNGMGYIGSIVWVDKGVRGLIPNGRNEDGTLKNIEVNVNRISFNNIYDDSVKYCGIAQTAIPFFINDYWYDNIANTNNKIDGRWDVFAIADMTCESGKITSFNPKLPVNLATKDMCDGQWVEKIITIADGVTSPTSETLIYDLSDYLPDDGYTYEVVFSMIGTTAASPSAYTYGILAPTFSAGHYYMYNSRVAVNSTNGVRGAGNAIIPIGSQREIMVRPVSSNTGTFVLQAVAYRRLGTSN